MKKNNRYICLLTFLGINLTANQLQAEPVNATPINPLHYPSSAPKVQQSPVLEITVTLGSKIDLGASDDGHRYIVPITGGTFIGKDISGTVIPGGADWQVDREDKVKNIEAIYALKTTNDQTIVINNLGIVHSLNDERYAITRPVFHAPVGEYDWLNKSFFVSTITSIKQPRAVIIRVYELAN